MIKYEWLCTKADDIGSVIDREVEKWMHCNWPSINNEIIKGLLSDKTETVFYLTSRPYRVTTENNGTKINLPITGYSPRVVLKILEVLQTTIIKGSWKVTFSVGDAFIDTHSPKSLTDATIYSNNDIKVSIRG